MRAKPFALCVLVALFLPVFFSGCSGEGFDPEFPEKAGDYTAPLVGQIAVLVKKIKDAEFAEQAKDLGVIDAMNAIPAVKEYIHSLQGQLDSTTDRLKTTEVDATKNDEKAAAWCAVFQQLNEGGTDWLFRETQCSMDAAVAEIRRLQQEAERLQVFATIRDPAAHTTIANLREELTKKNGEILTQRTTILHDSCELDDLRAQLQTSLENEKCLRESPPGLSSLCVRAELAEQRHAAAKEVADRYLAKTSLLETEVRALTLQRNLARDEVFQSRCLQPIVMTCSVPPLHLKHVQAPWAEIDRLTKESQDKTALIRVLTIERDGARVQRDSASWCAWKHGTGPRAYERLMPGGGVSSRCEVSRAPWTCVSDKARVDWVDGNLGNCVVMLNLSERPEKQFRVYSQKEQRDVAYGISWRSAVDAAMRV